MSANASEVAEPAPHTRSQALHTSTLAVLEPGAIGPGPVGSEAAGGGRRQQLLCYKMSAAQGQDDPTFLGMSFHRPRVSSIGLLTQDLETSWVRIPEFHRTWTEGLEDSFELPFVDMSPERPCHVANGGSGREIVIGPKSPHFRCH